MRHALITGGSRGIGAAAVRAFTAAGYAVSFFYEKNDAAAAAVSAETGAEAVRCDVADAQAVLDAARSGVSVLATLHGRDLQAALSRGILYHLAQNRVFDRYALLDENEVGCVRAVCDEQLRPLEAAP